MCIKLYNNWRLIFIPHANTILADYGKARFYLRNKNYSKNKITLAKPKPKYLVNFLFFGQQDLWSWHTISSPHPPIVWCRTFSPLHHSSLTRAKIRCQQVCFTYLALQSLSLICASARSTWLCRELILLLVCVCLNRLVCWTDLTDPGRVSRAKGLNLKKILFTPPSRIQHRVIRILLSGRNNDL